MTTRDQIRAFICDTFFVDQFGDDDSFLQQGLIDSTGIIELVSFVQQAFSIHVEDTELLPENLDSLARLEAFIERKRASVAA